MPRVKMTVWKDALYECEVEITDEEAIDLETNHDVFHPNELLEKYKPTLTLTEAGEAEVTVVSDTESGKVVWEN